MGYGIPYMGSKQGIVKQLCEMFPESEHFYDLFGGGGSVTHYMMLNKSKNHKYFHYNEINPLVVDVFKRAVNGEYSYDIFKPQWVSREEFNERKSLSGYIKCVWSFGNNGKNYLFSKEIESYKKSMHMAIVFNQFDDLSREVLGFSQWPSEYKTITDKRLFLRRKIEQYRKTKIPKVLYQFLNKKQLELLEKNNNLENLQKLQQLEQLERLQQLEQLEQLQRLSITNLDYRDVAIQKNSVVYCDIPYKGMAKYDKNEFDHDAFFEWAATRDFPVFISEYSIEDDRFECVFEIGKRMAFSPSKDNRKLMKERLYWNRVGD